MTEAKRVKLSQWDAFMLESLRSLGWSDEELLRRVRFGELPIDESSFQFDYAQLASFAAEHPETFETAVLDGYQIKYSTVRGIRSWISFAFGKSPQLVLTEGQESVLAELKPAEKERLASVLSFGWTIIGEPGGHAEETREYRVVPVQRVPDLISQSTRNDSL